VRRRVGVTVLSVVGHTVLPPHMRWVQILLVNAHEHTIKTTTDTGERPHGNTIDVTLPLLNKHTIIVATDNTQLQITKYFGDYHSSNVPCDPLGGKRCPHRPCQCQRLVLRWWCWHARRSRL
jgi:hypothetical protein